MGCNIDLDLVCYMVSLLLTAVPQTEAPEPLVGPPHGPSLFCPDDPASNQFMTKLVIYKFTSKLSLKELVCFNMERFVANTKCWK